jgi:predicted GIY-YIG superfamily endonuclease
MTLLYILYNSKYNAIKIGISDISGKRFASHKNKGWILVKYWSFSERNQAKEIESLILNRLRQKHGYFLSKTDMPQGGYTETFDASKITRTGLMRMINSFIKKSNLT